MKRTAPLELLDAILAVLNDFALKEEGFTQHIRFMPLHDRVKSISKDLRKSDFVLALKKLEEDKYINLGLGSEIKGDNRFAEPTSFPTYAINFNGRAFNQRKGYVGQQKSNAWKIRWEKATTFSLIFGGVLAGIYYAVELFKLFFYTK